MLGCCWYSRRITGTLVQGMAPSSVMMTDTYSAGIASYIRLSSAAAATWQHVSCDIWIDDVVRTSFAAE